MNKKKLIAILVFMFMLLPCASGAEQDSSGCIIIYGDSRTGRLTHQKIVNEIIENKPAVVFSAGDLVDDGLNPEDWTVFNKITADLRKGAEFYPALGNHENNSPLYFKNFNLPGNGRWYSVDRQGIRFIVLDSNSDLSAQSEQYKWLEGNLKSIGAETKFVIVIFHHTIFSSTDKRADEKGLINIVPLFETYKVDLVFSGHAHNYEKFLYNKIYYIVTGGGGAPLYGRSRAAQYSMLFAKVYHFCKLSISGDQLTVTVIDIDSNIIDRFSVSIQQKGRDERRKGRT